MFWPHGMFRIFGFDPTAKPTLQLVLGRVHRNDRTAVWQRADEAAPYGRVGTPLASVSCCRSRSGLATLQHRSRPAPRALNEYHAIVATPRALFATDQRARDAVCPGKMIMSTSRLRNNTRPLGVR
jgi:hypothetical protein